MASGATDLVQLRRKDTSQAWGFKMHGGREFGLPLFIASVSQKTISGKAGLRSGDGILMICGNPVNGWSQQEAKGEMMRAGNEVDLHVQRNAINPSDPAVKAACGVGSKAANRVQLDEASINPGMNEGSMYRNVQPKSYKILEQQLGTEEPPPSAMSQEPARQMAPVHTQTGAPKPASIFDRKKQERSGYLVAQGTSYQKTYGEQ